MKPDFTICSKQTEFVKTISVLMLFFSSFVFYSCTSSAQENITKKAEVNNRQQDEKVFKFHKEKEGKDNYWKVVFKDGKISELYKNDKKIPDENIEDYSDMVDEEIDGVRNYCHDSGENSIKFNFNINNYDSTLSDLGECWGDMNFDSCDSAFDSERFHKNMDSLKNDLRKLDKMKFTFHFDTTAFNKSMKELKKSLKKLKFNSPMFLYKNGVPGCGMEAFKEGMKDFDKEMQHNRIFNEGFKIDMSQFKDNMKNFQENMKNFGLNMKGLNKNMKKLNGFLKDLRHELVIDNLIKEGSEDFSMRFNSGEMIINGKKVPDDLLMKYKSIYKKHYGKDIDDEFKINNDSDEEQN
ncbi:MAG: hypothetical protein P4L45_10785 [Ignavibacteriaceae bacterium]|nr:hypothetical protein [Ignavibacteriaceae bacterium]